MQIHNDHNKQYSENPTFIDVPVILLMYLLHS